MDRKVFAFNQILEVLDQCETYEEVDALLANMNMVPLSHRGFMNGTDARYALMVRGAEAEFNLAMMAYGIRDSSSDEYFYDMNHPHGQLSFSVCPNNKVGLAVVRESLKDSFLFYSVIVCPEEQA